MAKVPAMKQDLLPNHAMDSDTSQTPLGALARNPVTASVLSKNTVAVLEKKLATFSQHASIFGYPTLVKYSLS
jgi:hypothetical protein